MMRPVVIHSKILTSNDWCAGGGEVRQKQRSELDRSCQLKGSLTTMPPIAPPVRMHPAVLKPAKRKLATCWSCLRITPVPQHNISTRIRGRPIALCWINVSHCRQFRKDSREPIGTMLTGIERTPHCSLLVYALMQEPKALDLHSSLLVLR